ncbi:hypothetical protein NUH16_003361 [Penicillium rubens]|nr:hypothetical protein NUH16_003280 [Penicillium rubens]KAJ5046861.1 hypothetical protein NUH16_003361 [Penicillium rubens]
MPYIFGVLADGDTGGTGDSPNTAMIVLYSITGIITALFLGNIITGAVRAHRHPERFGSRRSAGGVRQSRAPGIHRAMLDTILVVKFDDQNDDVEATRRNIEMAMGPVDHEHSQLQDDGQPAGLPMPRKSEMPTPDDTSNPHPQPSEPRPRCPMQVTSRVRFAQMISSKAKTYV